MSIVKKIVAIALAILLLASAFISCEEETAVEIKTKRHTFFEEYFDTYATVYDYTGAPEEEFSALCDEIDAELSRYHRLFDIYNEYEGIINLATLNKAAGRGAQRVDPAICELLSFAKEMHRKTSGKVNVAFGSVLSLWHDAREIGNVIPTEEKLLAAAEHTSIENIVITRVGYSY